MLAGGAAYAASKIGSNDIKKNAVRSKHIKNKQVKARDLAPGAVGGLAAFGQIRSDGTIFRSSPTLAEVTNPESGVYCLEISPPPSPEGSAAAVASVHAFDPPGLAGTHTGIGLGDDPCPTGSVWIETTNAAGTLSNRRFTFVVPR